VAHLLHIDSSIQGDRSVSRKLSARAADVWRTAHLRWNTDARP
jgi:FMN-dependent NADH-azoreductase